MEEKKLQSALEEWQKLLPLSKEDRNGIVSAMNTEGKWHTAKKRLRFEHNYLASPNASVM